jgi:hypothetical protein
MHLPSPGLWRTFASARYRPFQAIAIGQAFTSSFAADALFVPLLLRLGTPAPVVMIVGALPFTAAALQAVFPQTLRLMRGNLRRLTLLLSLAELRGFVHAIVVAAIASGAIDVKVGIVGISLTVAIGQTAGLLSGININFWTAVVLSEPERRLVGPRMGATTMALSTLLLLPSGFVLDAGLQSIGLWSYAIFFLVGGVTSILTPLAASRLPHPGRVMVAAGQDGDAPLPEPFRRFTQAVAIAGVGQGLVPYTSMYAIQFLGASAGFAVMMSGLGTAGALVASLATGSFLATGSSSRMLRASFMLRGVAALLCAAAIPGNALALPVLLVGVVTFWVGGVAGNLAANERLYRLAPPDVRVRGQSYYIGATSLATGAGSIACVTALAFTGALGWAVYTGLFLGSGAARVAAGVRTDVSPTWRSPSAPTQEELAAEAL